MSGRAVSSGTVPVAIALAMAVAITWGIAASFWVGVASYGLAFAAHSRISAVARSG